MSTTKDLFLNHPISGAVGDSFTRINRDDFVDLAVHDSAVVRSGDRPGGWGEVGTKALEFCAERKLPDGTELRVHARLKRHADKVTISWHVSASRDDADESDPAKHSISVSMRESGILDDADEAEAKSAFERISRRAATRCVARVAAAWGVVEP